MFFSIIALSLASSALAAPAGSAPVVFKGLAVTPTAVTPTAYPAIPTAGTIAHAPLNGTNELLPEGNIKWMGQIEQGGPMINITGTHYEVRMKIRDMNPYWQQPGYVFPNDTTEALVDYTQSAADLEKRSTQRDPWSYCQDRNKPRAQAKATRANIDYLRTHYGNAYCGVAPRQCGRFSCSWNSAVLLCSKYTSDPD